MNRQTYRINQITVFTEPRAQRNLQIRPRQSVWISYHFFLLDSFFEFLSCSNLSNRLPS